MSSTLLHHLYEHLSVVYSTCILVLSISRLLLWNMAESNSIRHPETQVNAALSCLARATSMSRECSDGRLMDDIGGLYEEHSEVTLTGNENENKRTG